ADAGLLETAKRHLDVDDHAVDGDAAASHLAREAIAALGILCVDRAVQAIAGGIGLLDHVLLIVIVDEGYDRAENLLPGDRHGRLDIDKHGRLNEEAAVEISRSAAAERERRAFGLAFLDI